MNKRFALLLGACCLAGSVFAGTQSLPITGFTQTMTATVGEQVTINDMPNQVGWTVNNVNVATAGTANGTFQFTNIVLGNGRKFRVSIKASTAAFSAPLGAGATYLPGDVSWGVSNWSGGVLGTAGIMSDTTFNTIVESGANPAGPFNCSDLVFTLAAKPAIDRAGAYIITADYRLDSIP